MEVDGVREEEVQVEEMHVSLNESEDEFVDEEYQVHVDDEDYQEVVGRARRKHQYGMAPPSSNRDDDILCDDDYGNLEEDFADEDVLNC